MKSKFFKSTALYLGLATLLINGMAPVAYAESNKAAQTINKLGFALLEKLSREENVVISPLSIYEALSITKDGASGETLEQMQKWFNLSATQMKDLNTALKPDSEKSLALEIANALYAEKSFPISKEFSQKVSPYGASVSNIEFGASGVGTINKWVAQKTHDKIKDMLSTLTPDMKLVIINAVYFKARWQNQFTKGQTRDDEFQGTSKKYKVKMMHRQAKYTYGEDSLCQMISLPYAGSVAMQIYLPKEGKAKAEDLVKALAQNKINPDLDYREVNYFMPKFKVEDKQDLEKILPGMGMALPFSKQADFFAMQAKPNRSVPFYIGQVLHKTFMQVDEEGTEAAAATAVMMPAGCAMMKPQEPVLMKVNRPFVLRLQDERSGTDLFIGIIRKPN